MSVSRYSYGDAAEADTIRVRAECRVRRGRGQVPGTFLLDKLDLQFLAKDTGKLDQGAQGEASIARIFKPGDCLLGGTEAASQFPLTEAFLSAKTGDLDGELDEDPFFLIALANSWILELFVEIISKTSCVFHGSDPCSVRFSHSCNSRSARLSSSMGTREVFFTNPCVTMICLSEKKYKSR